jgi:hypothetical protein
MNKILVVGLAVMLAATAGNACAGGGSSQSSTSSATSESAVSSGSGAAHSGGSGAAQHGAVAPARSSGNGAVQQSAVVPRSGGAPVVRPYPVNVYLPNSVQANVSARIHREFLDRSELLARQAAFFSRVNAARVQNAGQNTASAGQVSAGGSQVLLPDQVVIRGRHHRGDQNESPNEANETRANNGRSMPATNTPPRSGRPVLNFNNSNTMSFADACQRHRNPHDCNWWRNHCHTIILIGGGFYAWDLGYWYPAYGYDNYYSNYAYDGPIYGYNGLPPDQIIANVQYALQQLGYFSEAVDGVLGSTTRAAIEDYQVENDLPVTGAIDRSLLVSLGFIY